MYVANEEGWSIIAYHIPVAFFGVEFNCYATNISFAVGRSTLTGYSGETNQSWPWVAILLLWYIYEYLALP